MTEQAKKARAAYIREWRQKNPEKFKAQCDRYWERKAQQMQAEADQPTMTAGTTPAEQTKERV